MSVNSSQANPSLQGNLGQVALQQILLKHMTEARVRNPAYSLRSMAKRIKISPAALSEVLNDKRRVSPKLAARILDSLSVSPVEKTELLGLFAGKTPSSIPSAKNSLTELANDQFKVIANWYHFAILSLAETKDFRDDSQWIADRLNIRISDAEAAIERLKRLGMLHVGKSGHLEPSGEQFATSDEIASAALRGFHSEVLEMARYSLETVSIDRRDFTTVTMAVDPKRLSEAKKMIRRFRAKLCEYLEQGDRTEVYQLSINLFPLSQNIQKSGKTV